jgi:hypothetical protein
MNNLLSYLLDACEAVEVQDDRRSPQVIVRDDRSLWSTMPKPQLVEKVRALDRRLGQLNLVISALVRSLVRHELIKPAELSELMKEIDLEDGKQDGQLGERRAHVPEWCPKCQAKIQEDKTYCVFCGARFDEEPSAQSCQSVHNARPGDNPPESSWIGDTGSH